MNRRTFAKSILGIATGTILAAFPKVVSAKEKEDDGRWKLTPLDTLQPNGLGIFWESHRHVWYLGARMKDDKRTWCRDFDSVLRNDDPYICWVKTKRGWEVATKENQIEMVNDEIEKLNNLII